MKKENFTSLKSMSNIIYILAKIMRVCACIGIVGILIGMACIPPLLKNLDVDTKTNTITIVDQKINYEINGDVNIKIYDDKEVYADKTFNSLKVVNGIIDTYNDYTVNYKITFVEIELMLSIVMIMVEIFALTLVEKFFKNISDEKIFTEDNINIIKNGVKVYIASVIVPIVMNVVFAKAFNLEVNVNLQLFDIAISIMGLYVLAYIFEYGMNKGKVKEIKEKEEA